MSEIISTISSKGQVTIPAQVRRMLGLKQGDKIAFSVQGDQVRLLPASLTLESAYGSVQSLGRPLDAEELVRQAKEEKIERERRRMGTL